MNPRGQGEQRSFVAYKGWSFKILVLPQGFSISLERILFMGI